MRHYTFGTVAALIAALTFAVGSAGGQESNGTIRTYQGATYELAELSVEVFYTIGEPKERPDDRSERFTTTISLSSTSTASGAGEPTAPAGAGAEKEPKLLRGHSRMADMTVSVRGVERRIPWDQIRTVRFSRAPVPAGSGLPPYVHHYKHAASLGLVDGATVDADYVNMGGAILTGSSGGGQVAIPWDEVEYIVFAR